LEHLGLCYEKGVGVEVDLVQAARLYQRAADLGRATSQLSLGVFRWRGIGGVAVDRREAVRLWRLGGLEVPDAEDAVSIPSGDSSAASSRLATSDFAADDPLSIPSARTAALDTSEFPADDPRSIPSARSPRLATSEFAARDACSIPSARASRFGSAEFETHETGETRPATEHLRSNKERRFLFNAETESIAFGRQSRQALRKEKPSSDTRKEEPSSESRKEEPSSESRPVPVGERDSVAFVQPKGSEGHAVAGPAADSFALALGSVTIDWVSLADDRRLREFLGEPRPAREIARVAGEGIHREGLRCLGGSFEGEQGKRLCDEMIACETVESILRTSAEFYTRDTFLYRRVNRFLRLGPGSDRETGRNLGLYIGLLRECFCVSGGVNPIRWEFPSVVYRGANFDIDIVVDYARRPDEVIRWQGFTSASRDVKVALGFPGKVLFEISLTHPVASLDDISVFPNEHEVILNPYQEFALNGVRWDSDCGRWIVSVRGLELYLGDKSWLPAVV
jgi:hypothetical protein